jgi:hypothetical protein
MLWTLLAAVVVPLAWGWMVDRAFRGLGLARYFPLQEIRPANLAKTWDFQI